MTLRVRIEVPVRPTEDVAKVEQAVRNVFPDAELRTEDGWVRATSAALDMLLHKAANERVGDAARGALWRGRLDETSTRFEINKQAAAVGRVNFNEVTHPLGDIVVTVEGEPLEGILDRFAPPTMAELRSTAAARAALHGEERAIEAMGGDIDQGFVGEDWDEPEGEEE